MALRHLLECTLASVRLHTSNSKSLHAEFEGFGACKHCEFCDLTRTKPYLYELCRVIAEWPLANSAKIRSVFRLEITYTIEGDQICSIVKIGKKQYLDCTGEGVVVIIAIQEGNKNYWQSTKNYKPIVIQSSSGIEDLALDGDKDTKIYDVAGNRVGKLKKGINIIKMSNGTTKKVMVK